MAERELLCIEGAREHQASACVECEDGAPSASYGKITVINITRRYVTMCYSVRNTTLLACWARAVQDLTNFVVPIIAGHQLLYVFPSCQIIPYASCSRLSLL